MLLSIFKKFLKTQYSFEGKGVSEKTLVLLHRHWFTFFLDLLFLILLLFLPPALYLLIRNYLTLFDLKSLFRFLIGIYYLFWWLGLYYQITMYLLNTWIVTDHRIVSNEQLGLFNRVFSEANLAKIQDVSVRLQGLIPTILNYGNLEIQTAGTEPKFTFKEIPNPIKVKDLIMKARDNFIYEHPDNLETHGNI
jgi:hypothetical protein